MSHWDFAELRKLSEAKGLSDTRVYQASLSRKQALVQYHADQYHEIWKSFFPPATPIQFGGKDWQKAELASAANVVAAAQALHSMADILGQIINKVVLCDELKEDKLYSSSVRDKLEKCGIAPKVLAAVDKLRNSPEFKYIQALVNTIKHRRLLDSVFHAEGGEGKRNDHAVCFREFEYKGERYGFTWATDIIGPYRSRIFELIVEIGGAINEYLRGV